MLTHLKINVFTSMVLPSETIQVAGWGRRTENTSSSEVLLKATQARLGSKAKLPMMARECKQEFPSFNFIADDDTQICAEGVNGKCKNISINSRSTFSFARQVVYAIR